MKKSFYEWLLKQKKRDNPIGDLANDAERDTTFPQEGCDLLHCETYLERMHLRLLVAGACEEAHSALDEAWDEYTHKKQREGLSLKQRFNIFKRDNYCCQICGRNVRDGVKLEVDHKIPVSKGGKSILSNLWTLCFDCNRGKRTEAL